MSESTDCQNLAFLDSRPSCPGPSASGDGQNLVGQRICAGPEVGHPAKTVIHHARVVILMGVSGSGKTTIGQLLAKKLNWQFYEGDHFHPKTNVDKMGQGIALTDRDRAPWIKALHKMTRDLIRQRHAAVITCSALKQTYRNRLVGSRNEVLFVYLKGSYDLTRQRLLSRKSHFMKVDLLPSQFATLEEPKGVLTIDIAQEPDVIADQIKLELGLSGI